MRENPNGEVVIGLSAGLAASGSSQTDSFAVSLSGLPTFLGRFLPRLHAPAPVPQSRGFFLSLRSGPDIRFRARKQFVSKPGRFGT